MCIEMTSEPVSEELGFCQIYKYDISNEISATIMRNGRAQSVSVTIYTIFVSLKPNVASKNAI